MRIDPKCKIELASKNENIRGYATTTPYLDGDHVVATDGHILAVVRATDTDGDLDGSIPIDALKASRKLGVDALNGTIICGDDARLINGASYERDTDTGFISWRKVLPKGEPVFTVQLDAKLLWRLSQALGNSGSTVASKAAPVTLHFFNNGDGKPSADIGVAVTVGENHGVIMPMRHPDAYVQPV